MSDAFDELMIELLEEDLNNPQPSKPSNRRYFMQDKDETDEEFRRKAAAVIAAT